MAITVKSKCKICGELAVNAPNSNGELIELDCPRCGRFTISGSAAAIYNAACAPQLSGWIREQNGAGSAPEITTTTLKQVCALAMPSIAERANGLLEEAASSSKDLGEPFSIKDPKFISATYSADGRDVRYLAQMLVDEKMLLASGGDFMILPKGHLKLEELRKDRQASSQGFVAMSFSEEMKSAYDNGHQIGVIRAGYLPVRVDQVEHINRIDDEIIVQINRSRFVVADFTGHRGGVYFEAGYALGREIPIVWTCRKDDLDKLHFDIRQFNCIAWDNHVELAKKLATRIEATVGRGPRAAEAL